jgi:integrase
MSSGLEVISGEALVAHGRAKRTHADFAARHRLPDRRFEQRTAPPASHGADDDLVFAHPQTGKELDRSKVTKRFKAACREAGVRPVHFHDLRHTFGTRLAASGESMRTIQEFMGHADIKTTQIYTHYADGSARMRRCSISPRSVALR